MGNILLILLMLATLGVLIYGVISMMRGGDPAKQNKAMMWRVGLQAGALVMLAILFVVGKD